MSRLSWLRSLVGILALVALAWACVLLVVGGFTLHLGWLRLGARDATRALLAATVFIVSYVFLAGPERLRSDAAWIARPLGGRTAAIQEALRRRAAIPAAIVSLFTLLAGIGYGTFVAGGSDSYGYVSQAELWESGNLHVRQPLAAALPWSNALFTLSPLGYAPGTSGQDIVPTYPPGLPLLMAASRKVLGSNGQYYVVPALAALAVWLTFLLGRSLTGRASVGFSAALVLAASSPFLLMTMLPMSDVPAAAAWTLALLLALNGSVAASFASGAAAALAVLIRPNLVPVALVFAVSLLWRPARTRGVRLAALWSPLAFVCGLVPGLVSVGVLNNDLYGSPLRSGYGDLRQIYALGYFPINFLGFLRWIVGSGCSYVLVGTAAAWAIWPRTMRPQHAGAPTRLLLGGFILAIWLSYVFYQPYDAWWCLRFLLPIWPVSIVLAAALATGLFARMRLPAVSAVLVGVAVLLAAWGCQAARAQSGFRLDEQRYVAAAAYVARHTEPDALVLSMQHSGSLRYYAGRVTIRYERLDPRSLDRDVDALSRLGYHTYIVLDDSEVPAFKEHFASGNALGRLDWLPVAVISSVRVYDTKMATAHTTMSPAAAASQTDRK